MISQEHAAEAMIEGETESNAAAGAETAVAHRAGLVHQEIEIAATEIAMTDLVVGCP